MRLWIMQVMGFAFVAAALLGHDPVVAMALGHWTHANMMMGPPIEG